MSWHHTKENYDLSEHHPRRKPPNAGNHNMVAQIQPMVPELSVFSLNSNSPGSRKPLRTVTNLEKSVEDSLCRTIHSKKTPMPHQLPIQGRVCEIMRCEQSTICLFNLAYIPHIRQNQPTFLHISTKISINKVISTKVLNQMCLSHFPS